MNCYKKKQHWKYSLLTFVIIVTHLEFFSFFFANIKLITILFALKTLTRGIFALQQKKATKKPAATSKNAGSESQGKGKGQTKGKADRKRNSKSKK